LASVARRHGDRAVQIGFAFVLGLGKLRASFRQSLTLSNTKHKPLVAGVVP
jgi:hypothetical protein